MCNEHHAVSPSLFILIIVILMVGFSFVLPNVGMNSRHDETPFDEIVWQEESTPLFEQYNPATDRDGFVAIIGSKLGLDNVWYRYLYDVTNLGTE